MTSTTTTPAAAAEQRYADLVAAFTARPHVELGAGRGFGGGALRTGGKIFAMLDATGQFVVKLPAARVAALIAAGQGRSFEAGKGRPMREWLAVDPAADWRALADEALRFALPSGQR